ncbi:MAG: hypothetical protein JSS49_09570 [Planctomycetes bacterium]|nr:hypothetical protein [Planctomycetota bacterium]
MGETPLVFRTEINFDRAIQQDDYFLQPMARLVQPLRERGIEFSPTRGDIEFADCEQGPPSTERPFVLFDRTDGAFLWWRFHPHGTIARDLLEVPNLLGLIKISRYSRRETYNCVADDTTHHARLIREIHPVPVSAGSEALVRPISPAAYSRIRLGVGYWGFDQCGPLADLPEFAVTGRRSIDVFCAHSVNYTCPTICWHRQAVLDQLSGIPGIRTVVGRGRVFLDENYRELLLRSRICVSPWGWGETCIRDYEALLAGCVLIKPRTDFIDSALPLDERHYIACRPDFSDLNQRIHEVLDDWPRHAARAPQLRQYVVAARNPGQMADCYAAAFRESVQSLT